MVLMHFFSTIHKVQCSRHCAGRNTYW